MSSYSLSSYRRSKHPLNGAKLFASSSRSIASLLCSHCVGTLGLDVLCICEPLGDPIHVFLGLECPGLQELLLGLLLID